MKSEDRKEIADSDLAQRPFYAVISPLSVSSCVISPCHSVLSCRPRHADLPFQPTCCVSGIFYAMKINEVGQNNEVRATPNTEGYFAHSVLCCRFSCARIIMKGIRTHTLGLGLPRRISCIA